MKLKTGIETLQRIAANADTRLAPSLLDSLQLVIPVHRPGSIGGTPCVQVDMIHGGIDWDAKKVFLVPEQMVTTLTLEEVGAISESVRLGQSWHAYQQHKQMSEKIRSQKAAIGEAIKHLKAGDMKSALGVLEKSGVESNEPKSAPTE